ncbi:MAG: ATP-binding cassette domain-containing protein, partial [Chloroflexota bacterium]
MIVLRLDHVTFSHPGGLQLEDLSWPIQTGDKLGFVGPNGAGKSTILKLFAGILTPDDGLIVKPKEVTLGYLPQHILFDGETTVLSEALTASPRLAELEIALQQVEESLGDPAVYGDETALADALDRQAQLLDAYEQADGLRYENVVKSTLRQLGFSDDDFTLSTAVLSGGQKKMLALTKLIVNKPSVLLLDEPDNHLDLVGKHQLEQIIHAFTGVVIIVSHDRYLLDEVA